jgi:dual specificity MAP kinase phosphatase
MATVVCATTTVQSRDSTPPSLSINTSQRKPAPVPNKHIPYCSPGPIPTHHRSIHPSSPQPDGTTSLTYPPNGYGKVFTDPTVYRITAAQLEQALDHLASQPLPSTKQVFPWLHGLHAENQLQLAFFIARKKSLRRTPKCIRGLSIVKAGGDLSHSKIKGAISPEELLKPCRSATDINCSDCNFLDVDPKDGFSVRNFQIQACKMATVSDVVVYGDNQTSRKEVEMVARRISRAQVAWQKKLDVSGGRLFNTFLVTGTSVTEPGSDTPDTCANYTNR